MHLPILLILAAISTLGGTFGGSPIAVAAHSEPARLDPSTRQDILLNAFKALRYGQMLEDPLVVIGAIATIVRLSPSELPEDIDLDDALDQASLWGKTDIFVVTKVDELRDMVDVVGQISCQWRYSCQSDQTCGFKYTC